MYAYCAYIYIFIDNDLYVDNEDSILQIYMYILSLPIRIKRGLSFIYFFLTKGTHQIEVVMLRFALKCLHPGQVRLVRGNYEFRAQSISMRPVV